MLQPAQGCTVAPLQPGPVPGQGWSRGSGHDLTAVWRAILLGGPRSLGEQEDRDGPLGAPRSGGHPPPPVSREEHPGSPGFEGWSLASRVCGAGPGACTAFRWCRAGHSVLCPPSVCWHLICLLELNWGGGRPRPGDCRESRMANGENPPNRSRARGTELGQREASPEPFPPGTRQPGVPAPQPWSLPGPSPPPCFPLRPDAEGSLGSF